MMKHLLNQTRAQAQQSASHTATVRHGIVSGYDPVNYCAKVRLQPDDTETGWLPVVSTWVGNGWGLFAPVTPGDVVEVQFQEGSKEAGFVCQRFFNDNIRPLPTPSGEFWLVHKSGSYFKFTNDGKVLMNTAVELDAGNLTQTLHTLVTDAFMSLYNGHTHPDPQGGNSAAPNQQMTSAHLTSILKAN